MIGNPHPRSERGLPPDAEPAGELGREVLFETCARIKARPEYAGILTVLGRAGGIIRPYRPRMVAHGYVWVFLRKE